MDDWHLHWLHATGGLAAQQAAIRQAVARAHALLATLRPPPPLDILVQRGRAGTIPEIGIGGRAWHARLVSLTIDPANPNTAATIADGILTREMLHEAHHTLRMAGPGYGRTFGEALVSEGLACHFARTLGQTPPAPWESAVDRATLLRHQNRLPPMAATGYDHALWFFGRADIPRWFGYTLGSRMVQAWRDAAPPTAALSPEHWIDVPGDDIIAAARAAGLLPAGG
ncbi:DUF2268 domain-containing putative Zn-dependent protease [Gluconacetobacter sacchari]|uniref:DUF2268 domain-containing putative Zn-dependent protease n=1 Tax=Gluconacetobacter sacchari TaxID=92759 RepID=UPI0039B45C26